MSFRPFILCLVTLLAAAGSLTAQTSSRRYDISREPVFYTVGYAHLDTEWRWDYETTINKYLKSTLEDNFRMLELYKDYVFNFSGARRYRMMKEYYPEQYETLKKYISAGRWFVAGSSVDECDANVPSPESIIRQVLYGNRYFRAEFGKESVDFMLPDCFGFQAHLPSALGHAGVKGFSTQKLEWGSAVGIPFNLGNWTGPDGKGLIAALNATDYTGRIAPRWDTLTSWAARVNENGKKYGVWADYRYYGVGDIGGSPRESDIKNAVSSVQAKDGKFHVYLSASDQLFRDITADEAKRLPSYSGDLLLTEHSAGSLTSQAYMKRWNRKNELLAAAAEPLATFSDRIGAIPYPREALNEAWWLVLGSQMHDILPGTCIPKAYEYAWNDEVLALNRFASVTEASAGAVIRALDTRTEGTALVVYNPLAIDREDLVEVEIRFPEGAPETVIINSPDGNGIPVQITGRDKNMLRILFEAFVPSLGLKVYEIMPAEKAEAYPPSLFTGPDFLENAFYKVVIDERGDIISIIDKQLNKEILSGPVRLAFMHEHPDYWPAWNMDWKDRQKDPIGFVDGPAQISLVENGPVRAAFRIQRQAMGSDFTTLISLSSGNSGQQVEIKNTVKWQSKGVSLKAQIPLAAKNNKATYNLGLGTIERDNNNAKKYEVPSREWFDLTDHTGTFGVTLLEDCKFGSDKPNDSTLRLTLLYTPKTNFYHDQATQDWGIHDFTFGIYSHKGDWRTGLSEWQGRRLNQPLIPFLATTHSGFLGREISLARLSTPQADIRAMKMSENGDAIIFRIQELTGQNSGSVELSLPLPLKSVWETDGQERRIKEIPLQKGKFIFDLDPYAIRSFAVITEMATDSVQTMTDFQVPLQFDDDVVSYDRNRANGTFGNTGAAIPGELFPDNLVVDGVLFKLGMGADRMNNALVCDGQKLPLPKTGNFNKIYILAAAETDTSGTFRTGNLKQSLRIQAFRGNIGQFDNRSWDELGRINGLSPGFIKRDPVAWFTPHLHNDTANLPHEYGYIFKYELNAGPAAGYLQLPENKSIRIFAITLSENPFDHVEAAAPMYDDFEGRPALSLNLPKTWVDPKAEQSVTVTTSRKKLLNDLPAKLTMKDYLDIHQPNGTTVKYFYTSTDTNFTKLPNGMPLSAAYDGMFTLLPDDSLTDIWSNDGEGRVLIDLNRIVTPDSIHLFTALSTRRGPMSFSLWASDKPSMPDLSGDPASAGWSYLGYIAPIDIWGNSNALYTIRFDPEKRKSCRHLMIVSDQFGHGPFYFREIDLFDHQR